MQNKRIGFSATIPLKKAQELFFKSFTNKRGTEKILVTSSCNRILAEDIVAPRSLPGYRRSAMDGYAIYAEETYGASDTNPLQLKIVGTIKIADSRQIILEKGTVMRIATGAPVPEGANAVIKIEECSELSDDLVEIYNSVTVGKNVAMEAEDVRSGEIIFERGRSIRPWDIAQLLSLGVGEIMVYQSPRVVIISTGDELVDIDTLPIPGQVVDSNRPALIAWTEHLGAEIVYSSRCGDELSIICDEIMKSPPCDLIITVGGTSVGSHDYMDEVIEKLGEVFVRGVSTRPGKPVLLGKIGSTPVVALPGYPLAALLNFNFFVVPVLQRWTGKPSYWEKEQMVTLAHSIASRAGIRDVARLKQTDNGASLIRITGSGILSSLTKADYLLEIPEDLEGYSEGTRVKVVDVKK